MNPNSKVKDALICAGIVTYNPDCERLKQCLKSIESQVDYVIIVDNGSNNIDCIIQILEFMNNANFNIKLIQNQQNLGLAKALNQDLEVYGSNCVQDKLPENVVYKGMFLPDELPEKLNMGFGIVWDGDSIDGCSGNSGEYLKINNPHKASLYLAAGLPVIVWDKSAIADVVKKYGVGICVSSLRDLETRIDALDKMQYEKMCNNVIEFSKRIRSGYFGGQAVEEAVNKLLSK